MTNEGNWIVFHGTFYKISRHTGRKTMSYTDQIVSVCIVSAFKETGTNTDKLYAEYGQTIASISVSVLNV